MRLKLLICLLIIPFSLSSFAMTAEEEANFKARVENMYGIQKSASLVLSSVALVTYCPAGAAATGVAAVVDTLPGVAWIQSLLQEAERPLGFGPESKGKYEYLGGWSAVITDVLTTGYDLTDLSMDEPFRDEMKNAYAETSEWALDAFGESGYCVDQWEQIGILLGLR